MITSSDENNDVNGKLSPYETELRSVAAKLTAVIIERALEEIKQEIAHSRNSPELTEEEVDKILEDKMAVGADKQSATIENKDSNNDYAAIGGESDAKEVTGGNNFGETDSKFNPDFEALNESQRSSVSELKFERVFWKIYQEHRFTISIIPSVYCSHTNIEGRI